MILADAGFHMRTEWPEMLHKNLSAIHEHFLEPLGVNYHPDFAIYLQRPLPYEQSRPRHEDDSDVWLYLTHDDVIYEIPKHARWHPNSKPPKRLTLVTLEKNVLCLTRNRLFCVQE